MFYNNGGALVLDQGGDEVRYYLGPVCLLLFASFLSLCARSKMSTSPSSNPTGRTTPRTCSPPGTRASHLSPRIRWAKEGREGGGLRRKSRVWDGTVQRPASMDTWPASDSGSSSLGQVSCILFYFASFTTTTSCVAEGAHALPWLSCVLRSAREPAGDLVYLALRASLDGRVSESVG
jgi:hypothetical protein